MKEVEEGRGGRLGKGAYGVKEAEEGRVGRLGKGADGGEGAGLRGGTGWHRVAQGGKGWQR